jgi:hypothetical protein
MFILPIRGGRQKRVESKGDTPGGSASGGHVVIVHESFSQTQYPQHPDY